jgi:hypothetical protein
VKSFPKLSLHSIKDKLERRKFWNLYHRDLMLIHSCFWNYRTYRSDTFHRVLISTEVVKEKTLQNKTKTKSTFPVYIQCRMYV